MYWCVTMSCQTVSLNNCFNISIYIYRNIRNVMYINCVVVLILKVRWAIFFGHTFEIIFTSQQQSINRMLRCQNNKKCYLWRRRRRPVKLFTKASELFMCFCWVALEGSLKGGFYFLSEYFQSLNMLHFSKSPTLHLSVCRIHKKRGAEKQ